jgi:hypothetical protein
MDPRSTDPHSTRVVARYLDGRVVKGLSPDFNPSRDSFRVFVEGERTPVRVALDDLKGVFVVKTLGGDPAHEEGKSFGDRKEVGKKVWVELCDGECLAGWSLSILQDKRGFFLFPADADSNMEKVFLLHRAVRNILRDQDAVRAAREYVAERAGRPDRAPPATAPASDPADDPFEEFMRPFTGPAAGRPEASGPGSRLGRRQRTDRELFLGDW